MAIILPKVVAFAANYIKLTEDNMINATKMWPKDCSFFPIMWSWPQTLASPNCSQTPTLPQLGTIWVVQHWAAIAATAELFVFIVVSQTLAHNTKHAVTCWNVLRIHWNLHGNRNDLQNTHLRTLNFTLKLYTHTHTHCYRTPYLVLATKHRRTQDLPCGGALFSPQKAPKLTTWPLPPSPCSKNLTSRSPWGCTYELSL